MSVTPDPATEVLLPNVASMPFDFQGTSNACGTTSLAMLMTYLGVPETKEAIDSVIRRMDIFSSPEDLMTFARDRGLQAQGYNHGAWPDIEGDAGLGVPCILLIKIRGFHYVVVTGHGTDPTNSQRYAVLHDPEQTTDRLLYEAELIAAGNNVGFGFADYYMAFATRSGARLPPGNSSGIQGALGTLEGVTNVTNGISNIIHPTSAGGVAHGIVQAVGGAVEAIVSSLGAVYQVAGQWLTSVVAGIPVLSNIVQPIGDIINGIGAVIGDLGNGIGNVITDLGTGLGKAIDDILTGIVRAGRNLGSAFGSLLNGDFGGFLTSLGDALGGLVGAVGSAVSDAVDAVGSAISDAADAVGSAISDAADAVGSAISDLFSW
jgi:hypothetical protein